MMNARRRQQGFTLIEVVVALAIVALSLTTVSAAISQMADAAITVQQRTYASWIAQNKIAEMRLANVVPEVSETEGDIVYAGREWLWTATVSETGVENLYRVDVAVSLAETAEQIRTVTGFVGEPVQPGLANAAWNSIGLSADPDADADDSGDRQ